MSYTDGLTARADYGGAANEQAACQLLIDMIPNPDAAPANQGEVGMYFDSMSPLCAAQLRVELAALKATLPDGS